MSAAEARSEYEIAISIADGWRATMPCDPDYADLRVDAASIAYDLAVAVRHQPTVDPVEAISRPRVVQESVAW